MKAFRHARAAMRASMASAAAPAALALLGAAGTAHAQGSAARADLAAGKARAESVCAACHGANGISVSDTIPHLAGQRQAYLEGQLRAFRSGARKNALMNAIAPQLSADDIVNVAAHFSSLTPANTMARSEPLPGVAATKVTFPEGYKSSFTMYQTVNRADINQVRYLWANSVAVQAAREGRPMPHGAIMLLEQHAAKLDAERRPLVGADGFFVADRLAGYTVMATGAGWGDTFPAMLKNGDWNYAAFGPDMKIRTAANQAECLACHKPLDQASYLFSLEPLAKVARSR